MVFKEKLLEIMKERPNDYYSARRFADILGVFGEFSEGEISSALSSLADDGEIYGDARGRFMLCSSIGYMRGKLVGNPRGFAFFESEEEGVSDYFVPNKNLNGACHGDTVLVSRDLSERKGDVGYVVKILQRGVKRVVGTFQDNRTCGFVISDDKRYFNDVYIGKNSDMHAKNGMKVVADIEFWSSRNPEGKVVEILGYPSDKGVDVLSMIKSYGIKDYFDEGTLREANALPDFVEESKLLHRVDFRGDTVFTIDGDDSKDFDDAVSLKKDKNGNYVLGVHIADVSEYVPEGSYLDGEALSRASSVYFVDRVIPMLPEKLSNGICSLNEGVDRLTVSCIMTVDGKGEVVDSEVVRSVIRSKRRMTYNKVNAILDGDERLKKEYADVLPSINTMKELADILIERREKQGGIDFETHEAKIVLNAQGRAIDVKPYERGFSERIIEEFMILANCTVAEKLYFPEYPCIYRVHEKPADEKVSAFSDFVNALGIPWKRQQNDVRSKNFASLLTKVSGSVLYSIVNKVMLRTMQKAKYSADCTGHFGLSKEQYCHFTSPIRRYPDLFVHRMLKRMMDGEFSTEKIAYYEGKAVEIAKHCSERERAIDEAERDVEDMKKTEFLSSMLGREADGIISGVTAFGVFVELDNTCEGFVKIETLENGLIYNDKMYLLTNGQVTYRLGQRVRVRIDTCDSFGKRVLFSITE